jgi:hypothetical protein
MVARQKTPNTRVRKAATEAIVVLAAGISFVPGTPRTDPTRGPAFQQGLADRVQWENWFGSLTGY